MSKIEVVIQKTMTRSNIILFLASSILIGSSSYVCLAEDRGGFPAPPGGWPKSDHPAPAPAGATAGVAGPVDPNAPQPIDIVANEQEFAGDQVIAKGNVRVTSKGTVITAPLATLFRDPQGQPQLAIFTGHPHLVQESNKIDADKLTFEIATGIIHADGNAHSEVLSTDGGEGAPPAATKATAAAPAVTPKPAAKPAKKGDWDADDENAGNEVASNATPTGLKPSSEPAPAKGKPPDRIYTDSDSQIYEQNTGHFEATGHVKVKHGDIKVDANHLQLVYGTDGKPETALFKGAVSANQNGNNTKADAMTYYLATQRLQAVGNVRSKVIQQKPGTPEASPKKGGPDDVSKKPADSASGKDSKTLTANGKAATDRTGANKTADAKPDPTKDPSYVRTAASAKKERKSAPGPSFASLDSSSNEPIYILSDAQEYTKDNGRSTANGNVTVYYDQSVGKGQRVLMLRNEEGRTERIIFFGRSQVTQPGKRWIGDKITFIVPDQRVIAEGNTRAIILNTKAQMAPQQTASSSTAAKTASVDGKKLDKPDTQVQASKGNTESNLKDDDAQTTRQVSGSNGEQL
ncbi:MAG: LptA/OstA family protein [Candidatus Obscuribacterales bacterium]|nr:LptA/OstA family protein [Candidatus Obscuribacterales bacterium]